MTRERCAGTRNNAAVVDGIPGVQIRFAKADTAQAPTRHRILDHIGFDVTDLRGFLKKLEADGVTIAQGFTPGPLGGGLAFIYDPWGTYIELNERPKPL